MSDHRGWTHLFHFDVVRNRGAAAKVEKKPVQRSFSWAKYTPPPVKEAAPEYGEYGHAAAIRALYQGAVRRDK
jgi:hypothetical protein